MFHNDDAHKKVAMQAVSVAVKLDGEGRTKDAYQKYLECIQQMTHLLLLEASQSELTTATNNAKQLVTLCRNCLDRVSELLSQMPDQSSANCQVVPAELSTAQLNADFQPLPRPAASQQPSAILVAQMQNDQLLAAYMARAKVVDKHVAANLGLSVQRKMAENMAIAKQRERALAKKKEDRLKRLMEETEKRFSTRPGMSDDEMERRRIYTQILEYEQDVKWLLDVRRAMVTMYEDSDFIRNTANAILKSAQHPLCLLMLDYQRAAYNMITTARHQLMTSSSTMRSTSVRSSRSDNDDDDIHSSASCGVNRSSSSVSGYSADSISSSSNSEETAAEGQDTGSSNETNCTRLKPSVDDVCDSTVRMSASGHSTATLSAGSATLSASSSKANEGDQTQTDLVSQQQKFAEVNREVASKIQTLVDRLETMFVMTYEQLDFNCVTDEVRHTLRSALEQMFYRQLWPHVIALYRFSDTDCQQTMAAVMQSYVDVNPEYLGIGSKLTLTDPSEGPAVDSPPPYSPVINVLKNTPDLISPLMKLDTIARCLHMVCECVDKYYGEKGLPSPGIGADELLPILSFVIIKTQRPELAAECWALMDFIDERDLIGETGYCIASLQTALSYVLSLTVTHTS